MDLRLTIQLIYGIPSIFLYFIIFVTVLIKRKVAYQSPFWSLFLVLGVVEIFAWTITYILFRFPASGLFKEIYLAMPENSWWVGKMMFSGYYIHITQFLANTMITLNRFTAIVIPNKYDKIWNNNIYLANMITLLLPIAPFSYMFSLEGTWTQNGDTLSLRTDGGFSWFGLTNSVISMLCSIPIAICCLVINAFTATNLIAHRKKVNKSQNGALMKAEINLFLLSLVMFASQFLLIVYDVLLEYFIRTDNWTAFFVAFNNLGWLVDFSSITSPWLILLASRMLREDIAAVVFCIAPSKTQMVGPAASTNQKTSPSPQKSSAWSTR